MKKPIYFYVLLVLSSLSTLSSLYAIFVSKHAVNIQKTGDPNIDKFSTESLTFIEKSAVISRGGLAIGVTMLSLFLLAATWYFLLKRDIPKASYLYLGQMVANLLYALYSFVAFRNIAMSVFTTDLGRSTTDMSLMVGAGVAILVFLIFAGIIVFKLFRYQNAQEEAAEI